MTAVLSITIPTWNRDSELDGLLACIHDQTSADPDLAAAIDVLVSDNGSDDSTPDVVARWQAKGPFTLHSVRHPANRGPIPNINHCLQHAPGRHYILLGDDDRFAPGSLRAIVDYLRLHPDAPVVLVQHDLSRHIYNFAPGTSATISLEEMARRYYWYVGNAGNFVVRSDLSARAITSVLPNHPWTCWPQTEVICLAAIFSSQPLPIHCTGIIAQDGSRHGLNTRGTAYYIWETGYLALLRTALNAEPVTGPAIRRDAVRFLNRPGILIRHWFRMLLCLGSTDTDREVADLRGATSRSRRYADSSTWLPIHIAFLIAHLPRFLTRLLHPVLSLFGNRKGRAASATTTGTGRTLTAEDCEP